MSDVVLTIRDVELRRGGRVLISGLNLDARAGDLIALRGRPAQARRRSCAPSPDSIRSAGGTIEVGDARLEAATRRSRDAASVAAQRWARLSVSLPLRAHVGAAECLPRPGARLRHAPRDAEQTGRELLKQLGVESRADAWPRELSGGEAQRVAIARALAVNPPVLLMDEPMASLDPSRRAELGALLQRLTTSGRTLLVTTHDEQFAEEFATRVVTIEGRNDAGERI